MTRRFLTSSFALAAVLLTGACASQQSRMHRALDASMERAFITDSYLQTVAGISGIPTRLTRSDGFVYLADVAPQMLYLAEVGDTARYRSLRAFVANNLLRRTGDGLMPGLRYRLDVPSGEATLAGHRALGEALFLGWERLRDTASAQLVAQLARPVDGEAVPADALDRLQFACGDALDLLASDPAPVRAVLKQARTVLARAQRSPELPGAARSRVERELGALACLTRAAIATGDPDASVRYLDRMLDDLAPFVRNSGRPGLGTAADVLRALRVVRSAGPTKYLPPGARGN